MSVVTESTSSSAPLDHATVRRLIIWGLTVWFAVAVSMRFVGHAVLSPTAPLVVLRFLVAVVPLMALVTYPIYWWFGIPQRRRSEAAALMAVPGMFLDVLLVAFSEAAFPLMTAEATATFGAVLLFGYAVVLTTGLAPSGWQRSA